MTFFQPEQKSFMNYAIAALAALCLTASFLTIRAYSRSVNLEHQISGAEEEIRGIQTDKAQLQDKMFAFLSDVNMKEFSRNRNLVEEKKPQYIKTASKTGEELAASQP